MRRPRPRHLFAKRPGTEAHAQFVERRRRHVRRRFQHDLVSRRPRPRAGHPGNRAAKCSCRARVVPDPSESARPAARPPRPQSAALRDPRPSVSSHPTHVPAAWGTDRRHRRRARGIPGNTRPVSRAAAATRARWERSVLRKRRNMSHDWLSELRKYYRVSYLFTASANALAVALMMASEVMVAELVASIPVTPCLAMIFWHVSVIEE